MATDNSAKRPSRLGRGLTSLMSGFQGPVSAEIAPAAESAESAPAPRARLATAPPPEYLTDAVPTAARPEVESTSQSPGAGLMSVPCADIIPNPYQPRKQFDPRALEQLAASVRLDGVIQPIIVRKRAGSESQYELIAGERRWRAAQLAGLAAIPAIVRELTDRDTAEWALIENLQREDLNPIERAEAFQQLVDRYQLSHEQVADRVGVERSTITNTLRLLSLHGDIQQFVRDGLLSASQAKILAGLPDPDAQRALGVRAVREAWSVRQLDDAVRRLNESAPTPGAGQAGGKPKAGRSAHTADLERQITEQLGTKVRLHQGKKKGTGTLSIDFYSLEQFDDLLMKLGVKIEES